MHSSRREKPRFLSFFSAKAMDTLKFTVSISAWLWRVFHSWSMTFSAKRASVMSRPFAPRAIILSGEHRSARARIIYRAMPRYPP